MTPKLLALLIAAALVSACSTTPNQDNIAAQDNGGSETAAMHRAGLTATAAPRDEADFDTQAKLRAQALLQKPLTADNALQLALLQNMQLRAELAELGIARADVQQAAMIGNPTLALGALHPQGGGRWKLDFGLSQSLLDVLTRSLRKSTAEAEFARVQLQVTARLTDLLLTIQQRYYAALAARHRAAIAALIANAAETQSDLATQFQQAGNLTELEMLLQLSEAQERRLQADQAQTTALRAQSELATLLGESASQRLLLANQLPDLPDEQLVQATLIEQALQDRLDLQAARMTETRYAHDLAMYRKVGGVGTLDVGVNGERDFDGSTNVGPEIAISLPLFDNGSARIAAAQARLQQSKARIAGLEIAIRNEVVQSLGAVEMQRQRAQRYRSTIIPQRERIVALSLQRANFMLAGSFEALLAKRQEYAAYLEYVDALGAYWQARADLEKAVGRAIAHGDIGSAPLPQLGEQPMDAMPGMDHSTQHTNHGGGSH